MEGTTMTEQQKKAILILNRLHEQFGVSIFNDEDYFLLMDFVVGNNEPRISNIPFTLTDPQPIDPVYGKFGPTCKVDD